MPVELTIVESTTELETTVVEVILESASEPGPAGPGVPTGGTDGQVLTKDSATDYDTSWQDPTGGGAPDDATYLVTAAHDDLSAEIVVGATPGGELGGTWASPTVDATHSGSSHAAVQAAAEATAAAALAGHVAAADPHTGYRLESAAITSADIQDGTIAVGDLAFDPATQAELDAHLNDAADAHDASAISSVPAGNLAATDVQSALNELDSEKAATSHAHAGEDITSGTVADARIAATIARDSEVTAAVSASEAGQVRDGDAAGGVLGGTYPNPSFAADMATQAELDAHVNDAADAHDASAISIADVAGDFTATDVEGALAELQSDHEADATALSDHIADTADAHDASAISFTPNGSIAATDVQAAIQEVRDEAGGGGAPTDVDYLVGTASGGLSAEIVVGTSPGGELGGTWASPTVDATHSGSSHAAVQAAAEATAAAALSAHLTDTADAHDASAVSVDSTTLSGTGTDVQASLEELDNLLDDHSARHENGGADEISLAGLSGVPADVPPSTRALTAGNGLSGGGDLSADRSFAVNVDDASIEINTDTLRVKAGGITAAMVASDVATQAELDAHISDSSAAHAASAISADSTTLVGTGTDVQAVLEELDNGIADHLADSSAAHAASAIAFTPNGSIAATDVQAAIQEVRDEAGGSTTADNENLIIHMEVFA